MSDGVGKDAGGLGEPLSFRAPLLGAIAQAFGRRREGLRHAARHFEVTCVREASPVFPPERLDAIAQSTGRSPVKLELRVWPDGGLWLWAGSPRGGRYELAFHGQLAAPLQRQVVSGFEQSLALVAESARLSDCREPLLSLWQHASPTLEFAV